MERLKGEKRLRANSSYLYGPVPSRRLGYSLGIDLLPFKTCSMDCIYCQLGSGAPATRRRRAYVPAAEVLDQVRAVLARGELIEAVTLSGSGEPTLHSGIASIIRGLKSLTAVPVVVLTNSSNLVTERGRRDLLGADIVVPSLDAATEPVFKRINRPAAGLTAARIIDGLVEFRRLYRGKIWLEIMLVKGVNDGPDHLRKLRAAAARIKPDKIQLNTVVRPPADFSARPLSRPELEKIRAFLGEKAEIIAAFRKTARGAPEVDAAAAVLAFLGRRPATARDIALALGLPEPEVARRLGRLRAAGKIKAEIHRRTVYYERR